MEVDAQGAGRNKRPAEEDAADLKALGDEEASRLAKEEAPKGMLALMQFVVKSTMSEFKDELKEVKVIQQRDTRRIDTLEEQMRALQRSPPRSDTSLGSGGATLVRAWA